MIEEGVESGGDERRRGRVVSERGRKLTSKPQTHLTSSSSLPPFLSHSLILHPPTEGFSLRVYIWEKGNVGMADLSDKLHRCLKQALCDYILELYLLPQPIARLGDISSIHSSPVRGTSSPFVVLEPSPTEHIPQDQEGEEKGSLRRALFEKIELHAPQTLLLAPQSSLESQVSVESPSITEPRRSRADTNSITQEMNEILCSIDRTEGKREEEEESEASSLAWHEKEKIRREQEAKNAYHREAHHGRMGILEATYLSIIPQHLAESFKLSSNSVSHHTLPLLGNYSANLFLCEAMSIFHQVCPDVTLNAFRLDETGKTREYMHYVPLKTSHVRVEKELSEVHYVVVGRNIKQWDEARFPGMPELRLTQVEGRRRRGGWREEGGREREIDGREARGMKEGRKEGRKKG